ncbi:type III toxin-antitoxin system ToxN/AbiQ family toxin [Zymomonas mobilis]|uniref:Type III toxin-antitoxin system ToxN/AbiQ family toxin n=1 Tax=Zymomonas mobilis subsp. mobilis (strain ATCC 10988 / DSM 424 / LMG 404 / NCIMB 8938 / NRRL B-806 / ZM1) TaxID=555217 RepID=A0A0H3G114_ZYMMA|nr:type III toxin-antitoxin system ToxN/AbiQ family toxin [Zymomonas mobilis]AEH63658.1 conserved hypothetical protein [Zymomonas mobilis subsp. mobilis ATCC 10988]
MSIGFYRVDDNYINFLKEIDSRIRDPKDNKRAYVGIILSVSGTDFLAPLTSYKSKQDKIRPSTLTVFKLHEKNKPDNKLGMIQLGYMFPILPSIATKIDYSNQAIKYNRLLATQYEFIRSEQDKIKARAERLYEHVLTCSNPNDFYLKFSCDFLALLKQFRAFF